MSQSHTGKVAFITGANRGIGFDTAQGLARLGIHVVLGARDRSQGDAAAARIRAEGGSAEAIVFDAAVSASHQAAYEVIAARHGKLDILVNNAGVASEALLGGNHTSSVSSEVLHTTFEVNFFGVVATTKAAMPHLRASRGRVVTVTSVGGVVGQPFNEAYCAAKFAVEGFMESLAPVAATVGVLVSVVEPGPVATEFVNNVGVDVAAMFAAAGDYEPAMHAYMAHIMAEFANPDAAQTGDDVADVVLTAMVTDSPAFRHQTSHWSRTFTGYKLSDHDGSAVVGMTTDWLRAD